MIRLATLAPKDLNLNGDQGNLIALRNYLQAAGFEVQVLEAAAGASLPEADFYLVGHGSIAAMSHLEPWLKEVLPEAFSSSVPVLAVGSGALRMGANLGKHPRSDLERVSEFQVTPWRDYEVLGYRNTDTDAPNLETEGSATLTMLHGPVLAKNPRLLAEIATAVVSSSGESWTAAEPHALTHFKRELLRICGQIWLLEAEKEVPGF